jgi:hypothetical protein
MARRSLGEEITKSPSWARIDNSSGRKPVAIQIGIEGEGEAANIKGDVSDSVSFTNPVTGLPETGTGMAHAQTDWIASVTGRLGWA